MRSSTMENTKRLRQHPVLECIRFNQQNQSRLRKFIKDLNFSLLLLLILTHLVVILRFMQPSTISHTHTQAPCPLGASCEGNVAWSGVRAKYGWWRLHKAKDSTHPPSCLRQAEDKVSASPPCAFAKCLHPSACRGARNPAIKEAPEFDLVEECLYDEGYKNNTCGEHQNRSCRLCGKSIL